MSCAKSWFEQSWDGLNPSKLATFECGRLDLTGFVPFAHLFGPCTDEFQSTPLRLRSITRLLGSGLDTPVLSYDFWANILFKKLSEMSQTSHCFRHCLFCLDGKHWKHFSLPILYRLHLDPKILRSKLFLLRCNSTCVLRPWQPWHRKLGPSELQIFRFDLGMLAVCEESSNIKQRLDWLLEAGICQVKRRQPGCK